MPTPRPPRAGRPPGRGRRSAPPPPAGEGGTGEARAGDRPGPRGLSASPGPGGGAGILPPGGGPGTPVDAAALQGVLADALARVGDRWSLMLVAALLGGPRRFGDLLDGLDGLAPNILSRRLVQLEADGLIVGEPYSRRPVRHAYRLTAAGAELAGVVRLLAHWGRTRPGGAPGAEGPVHQVCGTPLEARWVCPLCDEVVGDVEAEALRWL